VNLWRRTTLAGTLRAWAAALQLSLRRDVVLSPSGRRLPDRAYFPSGTSFEYIPVCAPPRIPRDASGVRTFWRRWRLFAAKPMAGSAVAGSEHIKLLPQRRRFEASMEAYRALAERCRQDRVGEMLREGRTTDRDTQAHAFTHRQAHASADTQAQTLAQRQAHRPANQSVAHPPVARSAHRPAPALPAGCGASAAAVTCGASAAVPAVEGDPASEHLAQPAHSWLLPPPPLPPLPVAASNRTAAHAAAWTDAVAPIAERRLCFASPACHASPYSYPLKPPAAGPQVSFLASVW
jgi:hypothetical protein